MDRPSTSSSPVDERLRSRSTPPNSPPSPPSSRAGGRRLVRHSPRSSPAPAPQQSRLPASPPPQPLALASPPNHPSLPAVPPPTTQQQLAYPLSSSTATHDSSTGHHRRAPSLSTSPSSSSSAFALPSPLPARAELARRSSYTRYPPRPLRPATAASSTFDSASVNAMTSSRRSLPSTSPYPPYPPQQQQQQQVLSSLDSRLPPSRGSNSRDPTTPPSPAPLIQAHSDPSIPTSRAGSGSGSSGGGGGGGLLGGWGARLRTSSSGNVASGNMAGVGAGAPSSRIQSSSSSGQRPSSAGMVGAPPPLSSGSSGPLSPNRPSAQGWPNGGSAGRMQGGDPRMQNRHSFSEGQRPPVDPRRLQHDDELARVAQESLRAEEARLQGLAEQERQLRLTLAASAHTSEQDRRRIEELARAKQEEEDAMRRAMDASRRDSDKGKGVETEEQRREREELEMVMALSLSESRASMGRSKTLTSAQMFERLSRPVGAGAGAGRQLEHVEEGTGEVMGEQERVERRRGKAREDSFLTSSTTAHSVFNNPADFSAAPDPPPRRPSSDPSIAPRDPPVHRRSSSLVFAVSNPDTEEAPPPAYIYPEHAAELDEPDEVIFGPGRPLTSTQPIASSSTAPPPPPQRAPPAPPRNNSAGSSNAFRTASPLPNGPSSSHSHSPHAFYANSPTSFAAPSPPHVTSSSSYYSNPVAAALSPYDLSPHHRQQRQQQPSTDYFGNVRPYNTTRDSFLSTASVAGSFESNDSHGSDRTTTSWGGGGEGGPGIVVEDAEDEREREELEGEAQNPFDDRFAQGVTQPSPVLQQPQQQQPADDLFGRLHQQRVEEDRQHGIAVVDPRNGLREAEDEMDLFPGDPSRRQRSPSPITPSSPISPTGTITSLDSALQQQQQQSRSSLSPSPSPSTTSFATSHSTVSLASALTPSYGGFVSTATGSNALADEHVLAGVKWGFVEEARKAMHPPLEHEGDFPRAAQLSRVSAEGGGGEGEFGCFAVEARSWAGLLVYLMWHGNSRLEAAPADLERDKSNRGLSISIALEFYLSFTDQLPRVRVRVDLLPPSSSASSTPITFPSTDPTAPLNVFDASCPSISLRLPHPAVLPLPLSALATTLSAAHTRSRKVAAARPSSSTGSAWGAAALPYPTISATTTRELAFAIDLFHRLSGGGGGGGVGVESKETAEEVADRERGLLDRLKGRLQQRRRRRKGVPGIVKGGADGSEPGGRRLEGTGRLPEGANLITPFVLDDRGG